MEWLRSLFLIDGNLLGIEWNLWKVIGMAGNGIFFSRYSLDLKSCSSPTISS
jgi:hypothetical protein